jgi:hypothetical protein
MPMRAGGLMEARKPEFSITCAACRIENCRPRIAAPSRLFVTLIVRMSGREPTAQY